MNKKAFLALSIVIFASTIGMSILSPLMSLYAETLGASGLWLGIMFSGFSLSRALFQPISGWLSDRKDRKMLIIVGLGAYTLISLGYAVASSLYTLTTVRLLHGVASALVTPVAQAYVGDLIPKGKEGTYMNLFMMAMYLGMASGPFLGGLLKDTYGMNVAFYTMAGFAAFALLLHVIFVPVIKKKPGKSHAGFGAMINLLKDNRMKAVALHLSSRGILRQGITAFLPLFSAKLLGLNTTSIGLVTSVFAFTEAVSQGVVGPIADRWNKKVLLVGGSLIASVLVFFGRDMTDVFGQLLILVPVAIMASMARASASAYSVEIGAKHGSMGACMGLSNAAQDLGHFIGPILFGYAIDIFGPSSIFAVGGISGLVAIPPMLYCVWAKQPEAAYEAVEPEPVREGGGDGN
jgi:MFS transporter, DHA1 family, multidrug resistance protein